MSPRELAYQSDRRAASVGWEAFHLAKRLDDRNKLTQLICIQVADALNLQEIQHIDGAAEPGCARRRQSVGRAKYKIPRALRSEFAQQNTAGIPDFFRYNLWILRRDRDVLRRDCVDNLNRPGPYPSR